MRRISTSPSWKDILGNSLDLSVRHFLWQVEEKSSRVEVLDEVFDEGVSELENAMVAQFLGKIPNFSAFQKSVKLLWGDDTNLRPLRKNLFIVLFDSVEGRNRILHMGPWHIQGQPVIMRKWEANLGNLETNLNKLPILVQLKGVGSSRVVYDGWN